MAEKNCNTPFSQRESSPEMFHLYSIRIVYFSNSRKINFSVGCRMRSAIVRCEHIAALPPPTPPFPFANANLGQKISLHIYVWRLENFAIEIIARHKSEEITRHTRYTKNYGMWIAFEYLWGPSNRARNIRHLNNREQTNGQFTRRDIVRTTTSCLTGIATLRFLRRVWSMFWDIEEFNCLDAKLARRLSVIVSQSFRRRPHLFS